MTIDFPREQFRRLADGLRIAKRMSAEQVIRQQFKLTIRDAISATPPFDAAGFGRFGQEVSLKAHQLTGEKAVKRDIRKVFTPFRSLAITKGRNRVAVYLRKYAAAGNVRAIVRILRDFNLPFADVVANAEASLPMLHQTRRNSRGRVTSKVSPYIVLNEKALKAYIGEEVDHVGRAKGGWAELARIAGVTGVPGWISRHSGEPHLFEDRTFDQDRPQITFGNLVEFVDDFADLNILPAVFENRIRSMKTDLELAIDRSLQTVTAG